MILPPVFALLNVPAVTALIGADPVRVYRMQAQQDATLPHVVWSTVSGQPEAILDRQGIDNYRVQVDCWAADPAQCAQLAESVRDAMENGGENVTVSNNDDSVDPDAGEYRWSMDFSLWLAR